MKALVALLLSLWLAMPALAVNPDEVLADPVLEARARDISGGLRCLVCQNESIDLSDADLARELRLIVRERLVAGDSDEQVVQYIVDRYGEYVLLNPVVAPHTILLWAAAPTVLIIGGITLFVATRRRRAATEPGALTPDEQRALDDLDSGNA
ncbi:MAG: cytochrome c-type biogenesis protein CcmH [Hyphomicrobiales bacterium]|nr:MAG: cytochrome c-type biogenesis protein CcmH [Hyphomicrobiales bacterium]